MMIRKYKARTHSRPVLFIMAAKLLQVLAEERHDVILEPVATALVACHDEFRTRPDAVAVQRRLQRPRLIQSRILVAHVERDAAVLPQVANVLVDERQRRVGGPFGEHGGVGLAVHQRQVEVQRRLPRIGRPRRGNRELRPPGQRQAGGVLR
jgi:hypothetical protein